jgi:hypothetical protein
MSKRRRPGDVFADLRRRAGDVLAREHATGDRDAAWSDLRTIDRDLWPAIQSALAQCAGLDADNGSREGSGKLHPEIAKLLFDTIEAGLMGKLPPSWPEPNGHRAVWRNDADPQAVAALYRAAVEQGLIHDGRPTQTIAELFGVTDRTPPQWFDQYLATITADAAGCLALSCGGLTIYHNPAGRTSLADVVGSELARAAKSFRDNRGKTTG